MSAIQFNCVRCGVAESTSYDPETVAQMLRLKYCFDCNFWHNFQLDYKDARAFVIQGIGYKLNHANKGFQGFGGRKFKIKVLDGPRKGDILTTANLWSQGLVSPHFIDRLPNNAEFLTYED